ncbi:MAG: hypothetical protein NT084_10415 [Bacteroidetes bacterium]|jgi:uncharacterized FlaG/YvyC family protein|nr:hypothetical protein [Bacteroidota bacterium]
MKSATVHELKKELTNLEPNELAELTLRLAKFKKENKELLTFLLYEAHDVQAFIVELKREIESQFADMNRDNLYLTKKSLRKILRITNKYIRYIGSKESAAELLIYFISQIKKFNIPIHGGAVMSNMYTTQLKKINGIIDSLDEDLQFDYRKELEMFVIEK